MAPHVSLSHLSALDVAPVDLAPLAAAAGFAAIGLRLNPAAPGAISYPYRAGTADLLALKQTVRACGIGVHEIELIPLTPELDVASFEPMFAAGAELGARRVTVSGDDPDPARLADTFARLARLAAGYQLGVDLEFMRWRHVGTLADARAVVQRAGMEQTGILLDCLHLFRAGGSVADLAALEPGLITGTQLADAPLASPPEERIIEEARNYRLPPGSGELPLRAMIAALPEDMAYAVEVPRPPGSPVPVADHLMTLRAAAAALWAPAHG